MIKNKALATSTFRLLISVVVIFAQYITLKYFLMNLNGLFLHFCFVNPSLILISLPGRFTWKKINCTRCVMGRDVFYSVFGLLHHPIREHELTIRRLKWKHTQIDSYCTIFIFINGAANRTINEKVDRTCSLFFCLFGLNFVNIWIVLFFEEKVTVTRTSCTVSV